MPAMYHRTALSIVYGLLPALLCLWLLPGCSGKRAALPAPPDWVAAQKEDGRRMGAFPASGNFNMDTKRSIVHWVGKKKWPYEEYNGTLNLAKGVLVVQANHITSGDFTVDMNTMDIVSLKDSPGDYKKMMDRLRNYFFYVDDYPTIVFEITSVTDAHSAVYPQVTHMIGGRLTIKNKTNDLVIPATVAFAGNEVKAYSRFSINRNDYNIIYNENSFFGGIGNAAIKDSIDMALELVGVKFPDAVF